jgi:ligand-binding sensor domain-containing protein
MLRNIIQFIFILLSLNAEGQLNYGTFDPPHFVNLTQKEGLVGKNALAMTQDIQGYVWIGTNEGLTRYDGKNCKNFIHLHEDSTSLDANRCNDLLTDKSGSVWVASIGGLDMYSPDKQVFKHYKNKLKGTYVKCLLDENEDWIWAGTMNRDNYEGGGLHLLNKKTGKCGYWEVLNDKKMAYEFKYNSVTALAKDENNPNFLWVATEAGLALFDIAQFKFINFWKLPTIQLSQYQYITSILSEKDGSVWVGCWGLGLYRFYPQNGHWEYHDIKPDVKDSYKIVTSLAHRNSETLFIGSAFGVVSLDKKTGNSQLWEHDFRDAESFLSYLVWDCFKDNKGIWWFPLEGGVSRWDKRQDLAEYFFPQVKEKLNSNVSNFTSISEDTTKHLFYATIDSGENMYIIDYQNYTFKIVNYFPWKNKLKDPRTFEMNTLDKENNLWLYSEGELFLKKNNTEKIVPFSLFNTKFKTLNKQPFYQFEQDIKGNFWMLGEQSLICFNPDNQYFKHYDIRVFLKKHSTFSFNLDFTTDKNGFAYVSTSAGVVVIRFETMQLYQPFPNTKDPSINLVRGLAFDEKDNLWLSIANQGLIKCNLKDTTLEVIKNESGSVFYLLDDIYKIRFKKGKIWGITLKGFLQYDIALAKTRIFNEEYGFTATKSPASVYADFFMLTTSDKLLFENGAKLGWIGNNRYADIAEYTIPIHFDEFKIFDKKITQNIDFQQDINITYKDNFFSIAFSAIQFSNAQEIKYFYKLEGLDKDWIETKTPLAHYTNVPNGSYTFKIKAENQVGEKSAERSLSIYIKPPFWQTNWFYFIGFIFTIACLYAFYKYRIFVIKEKEALEKMALLSEIKALRAQMNPHFMFNALNSVKSSILNDKPLEAAEYLSDFAYLLRLTLQQSREKLISLQEDLETLTIYVRLEMMRFKEKFDFEYSLDQTVAIEEIMIPPMILQPYLENAIRHAFNRKTDKGLLQLIIVMEDTNTVLCIIEDNGMGRINPSLEDNFNENTTHKSLGMSITNERILLHNKLNDSKINIKIIDKTNDNGQPEGTRVEVRISIL